MISFLPVTERLAEQFDKPSLNQNANYFRYTGMKIADYGSFDFGEVAKQAIDQIEAKKALYLFSEMIPILCIGCAGFELEIVEEYSGLSSSPMTDCYDRCSMEWRGYLRIKNGVKK